MTRRRLSRSAAPLLAGALLLLTVPACNDDGPAGPEDPQLSLSVGCASGGIELVLRNDGGPVEEPARFIAAFADGERDTLFIAPGAGEQVTCELSNIHGAVTVTSADWGLQASADDCLIDGLESYLGGIDLQGMFPSPLTSQNIVVCTYTFYIENLDSAAPTARLMPTTGGVTLRCVVPHITGNLRAVGSNLLCGTIYGDVAVDSVVVELPMQIDEGGDPEVSVGDAVATVHGIQVNIDGALGFIVEWIVGYMNDTFTDLIETAIENALDQFGSDISEVIVVRSACAG